MTATPKFRGKNVALTISSLLLVPELQARDAQDSDHVEDLYAVLQKRRSLPRVKVFYVESGKPGRIGHLVVDGHHTIAAYRKAGRKKVPCTVRFGTWEEAVVAAAGANAEHLGLKRTRADKQRAVGIMLAQLGSEWSDGRIADHVGVSPETVRLARGKLPAPAEQPATRLGADNKQRTTTPKRKESGAWEDTLIGELGLKGFQTHVWAEFAERKCKTAGDLMRIMTGYKKEEERLRLPKPILDNILTQITAHKRAWEREHDEPAIISPATRSAATSKPGKEFDWKAAEAAWGPFARLADTLANYYDGFKRTPEYAALGRLANEAISLVKDVKKKLTKGK